MPLPYRRETSDKELALARESVKPFSAAIASARETAGAGALTLAWVSDLHLHARRDYPQLKNDAQFMYGQRIDSSANLRVALTEIASLEPRPDLIVFGGDLIDFGFDGDGELDAYDEFKTILDEHLPDNLPSLPLLGNHDHDNGVISEKFHEKFKGWKRRNWLASALQDDFCYETKLNGWRFIAVDSMGRPLNQGQLAWLATQTSSTDSSPTVVLSHRPFVNVGNWVDSYRFRDSAAFKLIDGAESVRLVLSGHTHKARGWQYRKKTHAVFPASAYGIGDVCGWGCVVLGKKDAHSIFVKETRTTVFESVVGLDILQKGAFRKLDTPLYEDDELCDPCSQPRRLDPSQRD